MEKPSLYIASVREGLRLHSRYIRDTLVPLLGSGGALTPSDLVLLRSILTNLDKMTMTLDLLRFSRIEKALMVIAATGATSWPLDIIEMAEELVVKWEDGLGPLKNLRADLYGPGGRLEGVRKITNWRDGARERDDDTRSAWSVEGALEPKRAHQPGHMGFDVGDWWLKPAAAFRSGIIDETSDSITADEKGAYAVVIHGNREVDLGRNGLIRYHALQSDPGVFKMTKTAISETDKTVRVLRSWKLQSKWAPKAGLRYEGLYRILSYGVYHEQHTNAWHVTFTLERLLDQPPLSDALRVPFSDQLDDWKDYQRLKIVDRGEDFAMLREIIGSQRAEKEGEEMRPGNKRDLLMEIDEEEAEARRDDGYFSRRSSKVSERTSRKTDSTTSLQGSTGEGNATGLEALIEQVYEKLEAERTRDEKVDVERKEYEKIEAEDVLNSSRKRSGFSGQKLRLNMPGVWNNDGAP